MREGNEPEADRLYLDTDINEAGSVRSAALAALAAMGMLITGFALEVREVVLRDIESAKPIPRAPAKTDAGPDTETVPGHTIKKTFIITFATPLLKENKCKVHFLNDCYDIQVDGSPVFRLKQLTIGENMYILDTIKKTIGERGGAGGITDIECDENGLRVHSGPDCTLTLCRSETEFILRTLSPKQNPDTSADRGRFEGVAFALRMPPTAENLRSVMELVPMPKIFKTLQPPPKSGICTIELEELEAVEEVRPPVVDSQLATTVK